MVPKFGSLTDIETEADSPGLGCSGTSLLQPDVSAQMQDGKRRAHHTRKRFFMVLDKQILANCVDSRQYFTNELCFYDGALSTNAIPLSGAFDQMDYLCTLGVQSYFCTISIIHADIVQL